MSVDESIAAVTKCDVGETRVNVLERSLFNSLRRGYRTAAARARFIPINHMQDLMASEHGLTVYVKWTIPSMPEQWLESFNRKILGMERYPILFHQPMLASDRAAKNPGLNLLSKLLLDRCDHWFHVISTVNVQAVG